MTSTFSPPSSPESRDGEPRRMTHLEPLPMQAGGLPTRTNLQILLTILRYEHQLIVL